MPTQTRAAVAERIYVCVREQAGSDVPLSETTNLYTDLNFDSLDAVEVLMWVEDEFELAIPDSHVETMETPGPFIDYVVNRLAEQARNP